jgi:hypothetical protein
MKTTVELFWKEIQEILPSSVDTETGIKLLREFEQAKEMEKQQHGKTWDEAIDEDSRYNTFEQYYTQTYNQNK